MNKVLIFYYHNNKVSKLAKIFLIVSLICTYLNKQKIKNTKRITFTKVVYEMTNVYDVQAWKLIEKVSSELKKIRVISPPSWAPFVKTGHHKELGPESPDWWYTRSAAVLRKIYVKGPVGARKIQKLYGGKKNRGSKAEHIFKGSGSIARKILQQLEEAALVQKVKKGRQITANGMSLINKIAHETKSQK